LSSTYKKELRETLQQARQLKAKDQPFQVPADPAKFCELVGFKPTAYQRKLLKDPARFIVARWCRQSGKTHVVSALLLWLCLANPDTNIIVVAPSLRQSKIPIRKISSFLRFLPKYVCPKPLKTKIDFYNGSRIQAFPNNPETIRGEPGVHLVWIDEFNYVRDDADLFDSVSFTLATTDGKFLATSTPGTRDSIFYRMCTDDDSYGNVSRHHITYQEALEPNGPLKGHIVEELKKQIMASDPWRWTREMLADFAEDEDAWLSMSTINGCLDQALEPIPTDFFVGGSGDSFPEA
jgi:hypothetical protein